jgi:hypothetical protein
VPSSSSVLSGRTLLKFGGISGGQVIKKQTPDGFLTDIYAIVPDVLVAATSKARQNLRISGISAAEVLSALERQRLHRFVEAMKAHISEL